MLFGFTFKEDSIDWIVSEELMESFVWFFSVQSLDYAARVELQIKSKYLSIVFYFVSLLS